MKLEQLEKEILDYIDNTEYSQQTDLKKYRQKQEQEQVKVKTNNRVWVYSLVSSMVAVAIIFCAILPFAFKKDLPQEKLVYTTQAEIDFCNLDLFEQVYPLLDNKPKQLKFAPFNKKASQKIVDSQNQKVLGAFAELEFTFDNTNKAILTMYIINEKYDIKPIDTQIETDETIVWTDNIIVNYLESSNGELAYYEFSFNYQGYRHYYKLCPQQVCEKETLFNNVFK